MKDINKIEDQLIFKQQFFTKKVDKLDKFQKNYFLNKEWEFIWYYFKLNELLISNNVFLNLKLSF